MATEKQFAANLHNAQRSTGPATAEGKSISSQNAVKTGLTVLLKTDDDAAYKSHIERFHKQFDPATRDSSSKARSPSLIAKTSANPLAQDRCAFRWPVPVTSYWLMAQALLFAALL